MSIQKINSVLSTITIPKHFQKPIELEFEELLEEIESKTKEEFDKIWTLLFDKKDKWERFLLDYEADKLNQLKKYYEFIKGEQDV